MPQSDDETEPHARVSIGSDAEVSPVALDRALVGPAGRGHGTFHSEIARGSEESDIEPGITSVYKHGCVAEGR